MLKLAFILLLTLTLTLTLAQAEPRNDLSFMQLDRDENGRLTLDETGFDAPKFNLLDVSQNGELSLGEFEAHWDSVTPEAAWKNVAYGSASERQTLDLYLPKNQEGEIPLLLWIHGGSWNKGSKKTCPFSSLTDQGIAVASINYRFTDEAKFPAQLEDCEQALTWLQTTLPERGLKLGPITSIGLSAGGQLSLLLGNKGLVTNSISFGAPTNFTSELAKKHYRDTLERLVGAPLEQNLDALTLASPALQVQPTGANFLLFHGLQDRTVPYQEALNFISQTVAQQNAGNLVLVPGGSHALVGGPAGWEQILGFLRRAREKSEL